jgi:hypothetical protein
MYWQSLSNYLVNFSPPGLTQFFLGFVLSEHVHGVGSNQFLSVNIGVIRLLSVITTTFAPTTKALFKFFMILKKTVGLLWNSVTKLIQLSILLFRKR